MRKDIRWQGTAGKKTRQKSGEREESTARKKEPLEGGTKGETVAKRGGEGPAGHPEPPEAASESDGGAHTHTKGCGREKKVGIYRGVNGRKQMGVTKQAKSETKQDSVIRQTTHP